MRVSTVRKRKRKRRQAMVDVITIMQRCYRINREAVETTETQESPNVMNPGLSDTLILWLRQ